MEIRYANKTVKKYCEDYNATSKAFNPKVARNLAMLMTDLKSFRSILDFSRVPMLKHYNLHDLIGDKKGTKALRVDKAHRMTVIVEFYAETIDDEDIITILEVSKHYGD